MRNLFSTYGAITTALLLCSFTSDVSTDSYIGYAYEEGTKNLIYTEHFTDTFVKGKHVSTETTYYDPSNKLIASRTLRYKQSPEAPDFITEDLRTGNMEGATVVGEKVKLFFKTNKNSTVKEKVLAIPQPTVIDGGFNQFIKGHWSALQQGEIISFNFVVPCKLDYYILHARKVSSTETTLIIRVEPENIMIRWLVTPIIIQYDINTKRILSYEGKSNISDENGTNFITTLVYPKKGP